MRYRMKRLFAGLLSAVLLLSLLPAMAWAAGFEGAASGNGTVDSPYQISTAEQLKKLSEYVNAGNNCQNTYFELTADIDLGGEGDPWVPIAARNGQEFKGTFDGGGHTVSGLYVNDYSNDYAGLFGCLSGTVENLSVSGYIKAASSAEVGGIAGKNSGTITGCHSACEIAAGGNAGGIVGLNQGTVSSCYNLGPVGGASHAGGIAGRNGQNATVSGCYNIGSVNGSSHAGGIAGSNVEKIENCYNVGAVTGAGTFGSIVGTNELRASITECYYLDDMASGVGSDDSGAAAAERKSENDFKSLADTLGAGWTDDPFLGRPVLNNNQEPWPISGEGTADAPFEIPDKETLEKVRNYINSSSDGGAGKCFVLTAPIALGGGPDDQWTPIGNQSNQFQGTFDGGGFTVSGLYIGGYGQYCGLFGYIGENGAVYDLTVEGEVSGLNDIGGIAGKCDGRIEKCVNAATVTGIMDAVGGIVGEAGGSASVQECVNRGRVTGNNSYIGGIVGKISGNVTIDGCKNAREISGQIYVGGIAGGADSVPSAAVIKNCDNAGEVRGDGLRTGGVIGRNDANCTVTDCRSSGSVFGMNTVGGVVGSNSGTVKNCYNTGEIAGRAYIGGVVGENDNGTVENCYNIASVTGESGMVGGVVGRSTGGTVENCYNVGSVTGESGMVGGVVGSGSCMNSYYLDTCCADGEAGTKETADEFASGEVAYLLQNGQGPQVWGQTVGSGTPELTASEGKKVFKITGEVEDQADVVWYSNSKATLPTTEPTKEGYTFEGWSTTEGGSVDFTAGTPISEDMTVYAVFTDQRLDGTGTVTMKDYTCGQSGVEPVAASTTNGTANVTFTYSVRGREEYSAIKPTTAGEYTVKAVFAATDNYHEVTATADFKITHQFNAGWEHRDDGEYHLCACGTDLLLETKALTEVPEGLKQNSDVDTVEKIKQVLVEQVATGDHYVVYDVELEALIGGAWQIITPENLPEEALPLRFPTPPAQALSIHSQSYTCSPPPATAMRRATRRSLKRQMGQTASISR